MPEDVKILGRFLAPGTRVRHEVQTEDGPKWEYGIVIHCWLEEIGPVDVWRCHAAFFWDKFPGEEKPREYPNVWECSVDVLEILD